MSKRGVELGNLKSISKVMFFDFHLIKTYAINNLFRCATKVLLGLLLFLT